MNQPKLSILGFSSRKRSITRLTHKRAVRRTLEAANRRQVDTDAAILLRTNRPSGRIFSRVIWLRHPGTATVPSSYSSLAISQCLFDETLNRQPRRLEIALTPRKQTTAPCSNRQLSRSSRATSCAERVQGCGPPITNHASPIRPHQSRLSDPEPRP